MPNYKDTENKVHFLSDEDIHNGGESLLPIGCIAITDEEAAILSAPAVDPNAPNPRIAEIKAELDALDFKKIRPLASGDTEYLAILQAQTVVLQAALKAAQG